MRAVVSRLRYRGFVAFISAVMFADIAVAQLPEKQGASNSLQMIVVLTKHWDDFHGTAQRYERSTLKNKWHAVNQPFDVVVGKSGLGWGRGLQPETKKTGTEPTKREGDGKSPAGIFPLTTLFGYDTEAPSHLQMPYISLTEKVECVDDPQSRHYNQILDAEGIEKDWNSFEQMRRTDELYRWGVFVGYNTNPSQPGAGSCIFLHIWGGRDQGTVGCTAMDPANIKPLLQWLNMAKRPVLVQLPEAEYSRYQAAWLLPSRR